MSPGITATQLINDNWTDGALSASEGSDEQWFTFTTSTNKKTLYFQSGTLSWEKLAVDLYSGNTRLAGISPLNASVTTLNSVPTGSIEMRIKPAAGSGSATGTYKIAVGTSSPN